MNEGQRLNPCYHLTKGETGDKKEGENKEEKKNVSQSLMDEKWCLTLSTSQ